MTRVLGVATMLLAAFNVHRGAAAVFRPAIARVELDRGQAAAGETIRATYIFRASGPADRFLRVFVHVVPPGHEYDFGGDFEPQLPTTRWPEGKFIREGPYPILLPSSATPGRYRILLGMFDPRGNGNRIELDNPAQRQPGLRYLAGEIEILPAGTTVKPEPVVFDLLPVDATQICDFDHLRRKEPANPVVLSNRQLEVVLDRNDGLPYSYRLLATRERIWGEASGGKPIVTLFRRNPRGTLTCEVVPSSVRATRTRADFQVDATYEKKLAASFTLRYALEGPSVTISLENVREHEGYELIQVEMPSLATVRLEEGTSWLAYPERGGQLVDLSQAHPARLKEVTHWNFPAPVAMIGTHKAVAALEVPSLLDTTEVSVVGSQADVRRASLGTTKSVRVPGGESTLNLRVGQESVCRLTILGDVDGDGSVDWMDGVKFVRQRMPPIPSHYYDDKFVYKIFCDMPGAKEFTTFEQAGKLIRDFAALTDNWPQIAYLVGWQYRGHDTGYPAVDVVNPRLGGYEALMRLMESARKLNCTVSFHDNYDDAYRDSPAWNEDFIAKNPDGKPMAGGVWAGGQSYIIGMARYASGPGLERARYTCERYRIRETYHLDVLSAAPLRHDWDSHHPASAVANLRGKHAIVDAFAKHGVDITSEGLSWPFIGKLSYFWNSPRGSGDRFGGETPIPLVAALYRKSAAWGGVNADGAGVLESLFYNCAFSCDMSWSEARRNSQEYPSPQWMADSFYLLQLPWFKLHHRDIETYRREGDRTIIGLGKGTSIDLDWKNLRYSVTVDGVEIARDFSTFCQLDDSNPVRRIRWTGFARIAFYSREAKELSAPLPKGWEARKVVARALFVDREPQPVPVTIEARRVRVSVPSRRPVMVYRSATEATETNRR